MPVTTVIVPGRENANHNYWIKEISSLLAAGNDVKFIDTFDTNACIDYLQVSTDGSIKFYTLGMTVSDAVTSYFVKGGFLKIKGVHYIFATGTDSGLGLNVKIGND